MLYVVSTPIGNLEDITFRAVRILNEVDWIAVEDTRKSGRLLKKFNIETKMLSYHEYNKKERSLELLSRLQQGEAGAIISDAGTPGISDPGFYLIRLVKQNKLDVTCVPGATAFVPALILSGCPVDQFQFLGFLPVKLGKKRTVLASLKGYGKSVILYESPYRLIKTLDCIYEIWGDIYVSLCRELTKIYEEVETLLISEWKEKYHSKKIKGEYVIIFVPT